MKRFPLFLAAAVAALTLALPHLAAAAAGVTLTARANGENMKMYFGADQLRIDGQDGILLFDAASERIRMVDLEKKETFEISRAEMQQMAAMMQQMRAMAEGQMQGLPEAQRKMAQAEMDKRFGGGSMAGLEMSFEPTGKSEKVNGWSTKGYLIRRNGEDVGEMWVTSLKELGLKAEDLAVLGKLRTFFSEGLAGLPFVSTVMEETAILDPASDSFVGVPVRKNQSMEGRNDSMEMLSVERGDLAAGTFTIGADFPKKSLMEQ